jgi:DNA-binding transcriptional ArsR family regulator
MAYAALMPRKRESVGKALRRALGEEVVLPRIEPRKSGISILMNQRRLRIFQAVFNEPGVHLRKLQRELGIPLQSLRWHVSVLLGAGILDEISLGRKNALFAPLSTPRNGVVGRTLIRDERFAAIIQLIRRTGEVSVRELVREMGSYQQLVSARLKALKSLGFVDSHGEGARIRYRMTGDALASMGVAEGGTKDTKERLIALLGNHGLAPKVTRQSSNSIAIVAETPSDDIELQFDI